MTTWQPALLPLQVTQTPLSELFTVVTADIRQTPPNAALPARTLTLTGCKRLPLNPLPDSLNTVEEMLLRAAAPTELPGWRVRCADEWRQPHASSQGASFSYTSSLTHVLVCEPPMHVAYSQHSWFAMCDGTLVLR